MPYASTRQRSNSPTFAWKRSATTPIWASTELAAERGRYSSLRGSLWDRGILPQDIDPTCWPKRAAAMSTSTARARWTGTPLRERIKTDRHAQFQLLAIAPTATISNIIGVSPAIEPTYQNLYVKSNLSGEFTIINEYWCAT